MEYFSVTAVSREAEKEEKLIEQLEDPTLKDPARFLKNDVIREFIRELVGIKCAKIYKAHEKFLKMKKAALHLTAANDFQRTN